MSKWWPIVVVLALQLGALALLPQGAAKARASGAEITLRTVAVDPWDPLAGRYVVLRYAVEEPFDGLVGPGVVDGETVWIRVGRSEPSWERTDVTLTPGPWNERQRSLRATWRGGRPELDGASRLYLPEEECLEADRLLRNNPESYVDLAVSEDTAVPLRLRIDERTFGAP